MFRNRVYIVILPLLPLKRSLILEHEFTTCHLLSKCQIRVRDYHLLTLVKCNLKSGHMSRSKVRPRIRAQSQAVFWGFFTLGSKVRPFFRVKSHAIRGGTSRVAADLHSGWLCSSWVTSWLASLIHFATDPLLPWFKPNHQLECTGCQHRGSASRASRARFPGFHFATDPLLPWFKGLGTKREKISKNVIFLLKKSTQPRKN